MGDNIHKESNVMIYRPSNKRFHSPKYRHAGIIIDLSEKIKKNFNLSIFNCRNSWCGFSKTFSPGAFEALIYQNLFIFSKSPRVNHAYKRIKQNKVKDEK